MTEKPVFVVSDLHLGGVPRTTDDAFREFLQHVQAASSGLVINGDLFDFWFEYRTVIHAVHYRVLARLAELVDAGIPVWFVGGNHDWWGGDFLRDEVGIQILEGPARLKLAGWRVLVAHGDGVGSGDTGYRVLRWLIRNPLMVWGFRQLHPDWGSRVARTVSTTEHKVGALADEQMSRAAPVRNWAVERLNEDPELDLVIAGHVHLPEITQIQPGRFYVNAGDWINHFSYVTLPPDRSSPALHYWTGEPGQRQISTS
jgi:UDP-2,3-diacylglucosamine hydrolase